MFVVYQKELSMGRNKLKYLNSQNHLQGSITNDIYIMKCATSDLCFPYLHL